MEKSVGEVLNESGLRTKLREKVFQIDRLESLDSLRDLTLVRMELNELVCIIWYEGIATQELYPHIRTNLIKRGVIEHRNIFDLDCSNYGQNDDYEEVKFGVSENSVQVVLKAYNPNYRRR